jgi:hypothetical protein
MADHDRLQAIFQELKQILQPFAPHLVIQADESDNYYLDTPYIDQLKKPLFFGAVQIKKHYVSYHLMPVYAFPALLDQISPQLKKRMQGKSCFNFTRIDPELLAELRHLTQRGFDAFRQSYGL